MPWVEFIAAFEWKPKPQVVICYRAGKRYLVQQACAAAAKAAGKAIEAARPVNRPKESADDPAR